MILLRHPRIPLHPFIRIPYQRSGCFDTVIAYVAKSIFSYKFECENEIYNH